MIETPRDAYVAGILLPLVRSFPSINKCALAKGWTRVTLQKYMQAALREEKISEEMSELATFVSKQTARVDEAILLDLELDATGKFGEVGFLSDMHIGSMYSHLNKIREAVEEIKSKPHCTAIVLGDTIECKTAQSPGGDKALLSIDESIDLTVEVLKPIQDQLLLMMPGNHEARATRALKSEFDPTKIIAHKLNCIPGQNPEMIRLSAGKQIYDGVVHHGTGRSGRRSVGVMHVERLTDEADVDFAAMGHLHHHMAWERMVKEIGSDGKVNYRSIMCALCGAFYTNNKGGFRAEWGLPATAMKPMFMRFYKDERMMKATV